MKKIISVIGDAQIEKGSIKETLAYETGKALVDAGYRVQCGGLAGVMEAVCRGAHASKSYKEGDVIGILPSFDPYQKNEYLDIAVPTGLDIYRNVIVASSSACIAIGGGAGTLCEMCNAWALKRMIMAYTNCDGWSSNLAGTKIDNRVRYKDFEEDQVFPLNNASQIAPLLEKYLDKYDCYHQGIKIDN